MKRIIEKVAYMKTIHKIALGALVSLLSINSAGAEPYVGVSLGWTFSQKLSGVHGNENLNYPGPSGGVYDGNLLSGNLLFPGTTYSEIKLKDVLQGGLKAGYWFDSTPNFGIELEMNYSQPNIIRQNVTLNNPNLVGFTLDGGNTFLTTPHFTEDQLPAKVKMLQFNLNGLYRYQGLQNLTPYIGGGPSLNIMRITGTGYSGIIVDPIQQDASCNQGIVCNSVSQTSVNVGINFKVGAEYKFDQDWGLAGEYHYNWIPIEVDNFRSVSNLKADYQSHTLSVVLLRHF
jgi:opacity protein-like surface antigen